MFMFQIQITDRKLRSTIHKVELVNTTYSEVEKFPGNQVVDRMMFLTIKEVQFGVDQAVFTELQNLLIYNLNI